MKLATWNLNNRVGRVAFRPEAADAAIQLGADLLVCTEYFPRDQHVEFCRTFAKAGWIYQALSWEPPKPANRTLIVSRLPLQKEEVALPDFDYHAAANHVAVFLPTVGLRVLGVRIPSYQADQRRYLSMTWDWLERMASEWRDTPAVILGDLNVETTSLPRQGGAHLRRILTAGWSRPQPEGAYSFYGHRGRSEIDHLLVTSRCRVQGASYITAVGDDRLAGEPHAISDHAALVAELEIG